MQELLSADRWQLSRISLNIYRSEKCFGIKLATKKNLNKHFAHRTLFFKTSYFRNIEKKTVAYRAEVRLRYPSPPTFRMICLIALSTLKMCGTGSSGSIIPSVAIHKTVTLTFTAVNTLETMYSNSSSSYNIPLSYRSKGKRAGLWYPSSRVQNGPKP